MSGFLALEDGTVFRGESVARPRLRVRRGRLHDRDDRLPGDRHRPELRGAAGLLHGADGRQLRRRRGRSESTAAARARGLDARGARARVDGLARTSAASSRSPASTRARSSSAARRGALRAVVVAGAGSTSSRRSRSRAQQPSMAGRALVARRLDRDEPYVYSDDGRTRVAVVDYGCKRSILRRLAGAGAAVTVSPARRRRRTSSRRYDGVLLVERARRSRAARRQEVAVVRELLGRVPILGICLGHQLLALAAGSRHFKLPFGHRGANHPVLERASRPRARHEPEPRLRGRAVRRARGDARLALRRHGRGARLPARARALGSVPSRGRARPARCVADHRASGSRRWRMPRRHDLESICLIGSGPIVIGQACEFDYAGLPGAEGAARGRLPHDRRQLEPGDDHDRPGLRRPHVPRAARPRRRRRTCSHASGRTRCCRRWAARRRSTSRASSRRSGVLDELGVELIGAPLDVIQRAEDRELFRAAVRVSRACRCRARGSSRASTSSSGVSLPAVDPAGVHARRPRRRLRRRRVDELRRQVERGPAREPDRPGARRGVGARLGRVRARGRARHATTTS